MSIELLPPDVVDQIAAGEVVERPAHLVKELVENAIDAGSRDLEIECDEGGRWVRVSDQGAGIAKSDLKLALARHATSKITRFDDLFRLHTFGFRGEALASIGAVSRLTLTSRQKDDETAHRLICDFGQVGEVEPVGGRLGTTVEVAELFANVPARLKFLKGEAQEMTQIRHMLKALALAHPQVNLRIKARGELNQVWPATDSLRTRAEQVLGVAPLFEGHYQWDQLRVDFVYSSPAQTARHSRQVWLFVQGRWVQDKTMMAAVLDAYRGLLMHGEYPIAAIFLTLEPSEVDVNIHPTKSAVKFRDSQRVYRAIQKSLRQALESAPWLPVTLANVPPKPSYQPEKPAYSGQLQDPQLYRVQHQKREYPFAETLSAMREHSQPAMPLAPEPRAPETPTTDSRPRWAQLEVLGQAHLTYVIAQNEQSLIFIDQHAAHERVVYERLMQAWTGGKTEQQKFLIPLAVDLELGQVEKVLAEKGELSRLGLEVEQGGPQTLYIAGAPGGITDQAVVQAFATLVEDLEQTGSNLAFEKTIAHLCATMACHSVVRAGQSLSITQMRELLVQMDEFPLSSFCPHGRPVFVEYPFHRLERDFGRIV